MFSFGKPSKKAFAMQLRDAISKVNDSVKFHFDASQFSLVAEDDKSQSVNLSNLYKEHCSLAKEDREANILRVASIFSGEHDLPTDFSKARGNLRPKIWNRSTFEFMELKRRINGGKAMELPLYPVGSHLYSTLVYDTENAMRSLSLQDLDNWGINYYEAFEIACQNLEETTVAFANIGDHFYSSATGDNYDSSRALLLDRVRSFEVPGDHIAVVPQRDAMHLTGSGSDESLLIMFDLTAKTIEEEPRPLCPLPMKLVDGEWVDWAPPKNHVLRKRFDEMELRFLGGLYTDQKELLDELFMGSDMDDPPFVASFSAMQREDDDDNLLSYCVWGDGVDTLLPRTQVVMLAAGEGLVASGYWEHVLSVAGDLVEVDDSYYPTRYRVREFPSAEILDEIGKLDLD